MAGSIAIQVIDQAIKQVDEVLIKNEQSLQMLQQNLQQVMAQKIGLTHNQKMLVELKTRISQLEAQVVEAAIANAENVEKSEL